MTLTQKILAHHAVGLTKPWVQAGDVLQVRVDWTLASELAWNGMDRTYEELGRPPLSRPDRMFLAVDHTVDPVTLATDARVQRLVNLSRAFAHERQLRHFYDANQTILHTKFYRELVQPGQLVLGADSHTTSHGGLGAVAIGLGGADVVAAMVLGQSWLEVPEAICVEYEGALEFGMGGKDVILKTLAVVGRNTDALERTVEYRGAAAAGFSTDVRFTIANMTAELGGLNGIFEADAVSAAWLRTRRTDFDEALYFRADAAAPYAHRTAISLQALGPMVARPCSPDNVVAVGELLGTRLDGCFIGACTTSEEELVLGGMLLEVAHRGLPPRAPSPKCLVVPGDLSIMARLRDSGLLRHYERAGFRVGPPGCSMCLAVGSEKALPGEVWLSSQNRNYQNRMGTGSQAFLASAATVAASSVQMQIADPRKYFAKMDQARYQAILGRQSGGRPPDVASGPRIDLTPLTGAPLQPERSVRKGSLKGRVHHFGDHVDTDAIIPGEFCHLATVEALGAHAFEHVRPEFRRRAREGRTLIVAGEGWGSGSSREQAVWALQGVGIEAVIAKSFAFIHRRNLVNEGLVHLVVRDPDFYSVVQEDCELELNLASFRILHVASGRSFEAERPSRIATLLMSEGGLVPALRRLGRDVLGQVSAAGRAP